MNLCTSRDGERGFKSRVQELNLPWANYEFAASTARPTLVTLHTIVNGIA